MNGLRIALAAPVIAVIGAWAALPAAAQHAGHGQTGHQQGHRHEVMARGAEAMGFDQERTAHHFLLYEDGGAIDVAFDETGGAADLAAVRAHLREIAGLFKAGDFGKPAHTHGREVPGTAEMTRLRERIEYRFEETAAGGRVRIVTGDPEALAAVHAFLRFQIEDHGTGDPGDVRAAPEG